MEKIGAKASKEAKSRTFLRLLFLTIIYRVSAYRNVLRNL